MLKGSLRVFRKIWRWQFLFEDGNEEFFSLFTENEVKGSQIFFHAEEWRLSFPEFYKDCIFKVFEVLKIPVKIVMKMRTNLCAKYTTLRLSQTLIGCSTLSQEDCMLIGRCCEVMTTLTVGHCCLVIWGEILIFQNPCRDIKRMW